MNRPLPLLYLRTLLALCLAPVLSAGGPEVIVVADARPEAATLQPAPGRTVFYQLITGREHTIGRAFAGEPLPTTAAVESAVVEALARRGYIRTRPGGPAPSLCILTLWGSANALLDEIPGEDGGTIFFNQRELRQLTGANKALRRHGADPRENDTINEAMREDRVYVMLGAFDAAALAQRKKKLLWRTAMSVDSLRHPFPGSLTVMLASAAPCFGRDEDRALVITDTERRARVDLAPLDFLETVPARPDTK